MEREVLIPMAWLILLVGCARWPGPLGEPAPAGHASPTAGADATSPPPRAPGPQTDPSLVPLRRVPGEDWRSLERYRLVADLDFDGIQDLALSHDTGMFGNAGGWFTIFMGNADGTFSKIGGVFAHPLAVSLTKREGSGGILATYHRMNSGSGSVIWYSVTPEGVTETGKREIFPGDSGTPEGRAEYARIFNNTDRLRPQTSKTKDGEVTWVDYLPWAFRNSQD